MTSFFMFFVRNHKFAILFSVMLILLGVNALYKTSKNVFPKVDFGTVLVYTLHPNASPADIELSITNKIEDAIDGISGIDEYVSDSIESVSRITIKLDPNIDNDDEVVQKIRDAVSSISDFPADLEKLPKIIRLTSGDFPFMDVAIGSDTLDYGALRAKAKELKRQLLAIPGMAAVTTYGYKEREVHITADPQKLATYELTITDITQAIRDQNVRTSLGTVENTTDEKAIVTLAEIRDTARIESLILRTTFEGTPIRVRDVATVSNGFDDTPQRARLNGSRAILFTLIKNDSSDLLELATRVKTFLKAENERQSEALITYTRDMSKYLENRFNVVKNNGIIGLLLLLLVLGVFLDRRVAFWVGLSIPVIVYGVFWLLPFFVPHIDIISLAAFIIVMGIIVDDGIIIAENILRRREAGDTPIMAAVNGVSEVFGPVLTTILTTLVAFGPMFFMPGIVGKFIVVIPLVITLALFLSLLEVTIALPAHLAPSLKKIAPAQPTGSWFGRFRAGFEKKITAWLKWRYVIVLGYFLLFAGSVIFTLKYKNIVLFPSSQAEIIFCQIELPVGSSLDRTNRVTKQVENIIGTLPSSDLDAYLSRIGLKGKDEDSSSESARHTQIAIYLTPYSSRDRTAEDIRKTLREKSRAITDATVRYTIQAGGPPVGEPIEIRVSHFDNDTRRDIASNVVALLADTTGAFDISRNDTLGKRRIEMVMDHDKIKRLGFTAQQLSNQVKAAYSGAVAGSVRLDNEDVDFKVWLTKADRSSLATLSALPVRNNSNRMMQLGDVVALSIREGVANFSHINGERTTTIVANTDKSVLSPIEVYQTLTPILSDPDFTRGGQIRFGGESEETKKSFIELGKLFIIALIGIYFLLVLLFNSFGQPLVIISCIPLGLIGVIAAFTIHQQDLGFFAMLGSIGLTGVLVNDSLVLVDRINRLKKEQPDTPLKTLVATGAAERFRPIVLTSLTTVAGVLPLAYGWGGEDPFISPMGLALGYGLLFSTPLILVYIPAMVLIYDDIIRLVSRLFHRLKSR